MTYSRKCFRVLAFKYFCKVIVRDEDGKGLNDETLISQSLTFLMAGQETTAGLLSWAIFFLCKHPGSVFLIQV